MDGGDTPKVAHGLQIKVCWRRDWSIRARSMCCRTVLCRRSNPSLRG